MGKVERVYRTGVARRGNVGGGREGWGGGRAGLFESVKRVGGLITVESRF